MNEPKSRVERFNQRIRNNPVFAALIVIGTLIIALSAFTDAAKNLLDLITLDVRPDINGNWEAEVNYDWNNASYVEKFNFRGDGEELYGTASFLGSKKSILDGVVKKDKLLFNTKSRQILGSEESKVSIRHYRGKYSAGQIKFVLQTEGGYSEHVPIEFTANRVPDNKN